MNYIKLLYITHSFNVLQTVAMFYRRFDVYLHHRLGIFCPDPHTTITKPFAFATSSTKSKGFLGIEYDEINKMKIRNSANK